MKTAPDEETRADNTTRNVERICTSKGGRAKMKDERKALPLFCETGEETHVDERPNCGNVPMNA